MQFSKARGCVSNYVSVGGYLLITQFQELVVQSLGCSQPIFGIFCAKITDQIDAVVPFLWNSVPCLVELRLPEDTAFAGGEEMATVGIVRLVPNPEPVALDHISQHSTQRPCIACLE